MVVDYPSAAGQIRAGKIRPLAVAPPTRLGSLPDVPTVQEALGLADFEAYAWQGLVVPAGDARSGRRAPFGRARRCRRRAERRRPHAEIGLEPLPGGPADMQA